jgi:hypothetical protein
MFRGFFIANVGMVTGTVERISLVLLKAITIAGSVTIDY